MDETSDPHSSQDYRRGGWHTQRVSSSLARLPFGTRRKIAAILAGFCALFLAIGAVSSTGRGEASAPVFAVLGFVVAVLLGLIAWGVYRSIGLDRAELRMDAVIHDTLTRAGGRGQLCDCGHEHDPSELHVTDAECAHDGSGVACAHDCDTCVLKQR
jgi:hypothetical protein